MRAVKSSKMSDTLFCTALASYQKFIDIVMTFTSL